MNPFAAATLAALSLPAFPAPADDPAGPKRAFRAGAAAVDASPPGLPVYVNGGFLEGRSARVYDPPHARALVLDDGASKVAICVVDSCMMPRDLIDRAKDQARDKTGIPTDRMLVSATHTHSAPAAMGALGCPVDAGYAAFLPGKIAEAVEKAAANLRPAKVGWASVDDPDDTHNRRWIRRPDRPVVDPFGLPSARAHMHPGYQNPDAIGPSGPIDPELSVLAVQTPGGKPIAVLANYSMHYFGTPAVSADYFGRFARLIGERVGAGGDDPAFVGIMSQGTSGDQHWMDYGRPKPDLTIDTYASRMTDAALRAYRAIEFRDWVPLAMAETTLRLRRRVPNEARLAWARKVADAMGDRSPKTLPEVYAREAIELHDNPERELKLQAVRIGDLGIAAIPNEVYALTGLKIKARGPLKKTFTIELANGAEGYIPPPEQHALGGYTTWPARTAGLEVEAEPRITEAVVGLLTSVAGSASRKVEPAPTSYSRLVLGMRPWAYWRLEEMQGSVAFDSSGRGHDARLVPGYALFLDGPGTDGDRPGRPVNHAVHLAGGAVVSGDGAVPASRRSFVLEFWNGLPADARDVTGTLLQLDGTPWRVGIRGRGAAAGELFLTGEGRSASGRTVVSLKQWHHLAVVFAPGWVSVYLDGVYEAGCETEGRSADASRLAVGGAPGSASSFEGKVDEVAVFDRALTPAEVRRLAEGFRDGSGAGRK